MAPSAMPRAAASSSWISSSGSPSIARRLRTLTKLELRKLRAGGEIIASGNVRRTAGRLVVGHVVGQAVLAHRGQPLAEEFAAARRRREVALGERRIGQLQRREALRLQLLEVDHVGREGAAAQGLVVVGEARLVEAHAPRQFAKHPGVAARLAARRDGRRGSAARRCGRSWSGCPSARAAWWRAARSRRSRRCRSGTAPAPR